MRTMALKLGLVGVGLSLCLGVFVFDNSASAWERRRITSGWVYWCDTGVNGGGSLCATLDHNTFGAGSDEEVNLIIGQANSGPYDSSMSWKCDDGVWRRVDRYNKTGRSAGHIYNFCLYPDTLVEAYGMIDDL